VKALPLVLLLALPALAHAEPPHDLVADDVVLRGGRLEGALSYESDQSARIYGNPWSLAPDLFYGLTDELTLGVAHSARALWLVDSGGGLCLADDGCAATYDDLTVDARYAFLRREGMSVAAHLRFVNHSFDPWKPSLRAGAVARWTWGRFAVLSDPELQIGLDHRDLGNRDWLRWPWMLAVQPMQRVRLALRTGIEGELATFGDSFVIAMALDLTVRVRPNLDASVMYGYPAAAGPLNDGNERHLGVTVTARWP
jgi:hypothetical protein